MRGKRSLLILALVTLVGFPLIGYFLNYFFHFTPIEYLFVTHIGYFNEIIIGGAVGIVLAWMGWLLVQSALLKGAYDDIESKLRFFNLTPTDIILISLCAGIGEEIFFRGFIQPVLGIWPTAILFVGIHGYLRPDKWRKSIYGIYMTLVIALLGYMRHYMGLTSAITAHALIDMVLFYLTIQEEK